MRRRNLSGIYIFDQFPGETRRKPTCLEDCQVEIRNAWLEKQTKECLIKAVNMLCNTICKISDEFGIVAKYE